jgi:hypothetical protein
MKIIPHLRRYFGRSGRTKRRCKRHRKSRDIAFAPTHSQSSTMTSSSLPRRRLRRGASTISTSSSSSASTVLDRARLVAASFLILRAAASRSCLCECVYAIYLVVHLTLYRRRTWRSSSGVSSSSGLSSSGSGVGSRGMMWRARSAARTCISMPAISRT